jgi:hypothetical protein
MKKTLSLNSFVKMLRNNLLSIWAILFLTILLGLFFSPLFCWGNLLSNENNKLVELYTLSWSIFVSFVAVILYFRKDKDDFDDYLVQGIEVVEILDYQKIRTTLSNPTPFNRNVEYSCLIVTKEGSNIVQKVNENLHTSFSNTNSFIELKNRNSFFNKDFAFIPLSYYSNENIQVGNESLVFELLINCACKAETLSNYNVRFFVFRPKKDSNNYHRSVSAVFKAKSIESAFEKLETNLKEAENYKSCNSIKNQK